MLLICIYILWIFSARNVIYNNVFNLILWLRKKDCFSSWRSKEVSLRKLMNCLESKEPSNRYPNWSGIQPGYRFDFSSQYFDISWAESSIWCFSKSLIIIQFPTFNGEYLFGVTDQKTVYCVQYTTWFDKHCYYVDIYLLTHNYWIDAMLSCLISIFYVLVV